MAVDIKAGEKLKQLRLFFHVSRQMVEDEAKIPSSTLKFWENGNIRPNSEKFLNYLKFFKNFGANVSIDWLLNDQESLESFDNLKKPSLIRNFVQEQTLITNIMKIIEQVSTLCYYLDNKEKVSYLNAKTISFLVQDPQKIYNSNHSELTLKEISTEDMYDDCLKHYNIALSNKQVQFDYHIGNNSMTDLLVKSPSYRMLYIPLESHEQKVIGVLAFLYNKIIE